MFRIRVSVANVFVLQASTGIVDAQHSVEVPVSLKKTLPVELFQDSKLTVKLAVEFVLYTSEYETRGSKAFWSQHGSEALRKTIVCSVERAAAHKSSIHSLDAAQLGAFDGNRAGRADTEASGASQISISPDVLEFEGAFDLYGRLSCSFQFC